MADWTIPGNHTVAKDFGAALEISSSHHDFKGKRYICVIEMRTPAGEWLGPMVTVVVDTINAVITTFDGTTVEFPTIQFSHAGVQGLLDKVKIINFVKANVPDPRTPPAP